MYPYNVYNIQVILTLLRSTPYRIIISEDTDVSPDAEAEPVTLHFPLTLSGVHFCHASLVESSFLFGRDRPGGSSWP